MQLTDVKKSPQRTGQPSSFSQLLKDSGLPQDSVTTGLTNADLLQLQVDLLQAQRLAELARRLSPEAIRKQNHAMAMAAIQGRPY